MTHKTLTQAAIPLLVFALGCGGGDQEPPTNADGGAGGSGGNTSTAAGGSTSTGTVTGGGGEAPCVQVGTVTGQVLDQDGGVPTNHTITVCGNACMYGELATDGSFSMQVDFCYAASTFYDVPVFIYHGWPTYTDVTVNFVPDGADEVPQVDVGVITATSTAGMAKFPYPEPAAATFADGNGFSVEVAANTVEIPAFEEDVAVGAIPAEDFPLSDPPVDLAGLYFVGPDNSMLTEPATVQFPNTTQLAAGTAVELMALGNMGTTGIIAAGTFDVVGTGRVTNDGLSVVSDPAQDTGLITFGWIGYRVAQ